jgi:hypothetical protein
MPNTHTQSAVIASHSPSENVPSADGRCCAGVAVLPQRDACDLCGSTCWDSAHFAMGKLWCEECWQGREPAEAKPPSPSEARQLALWMLPQPKSQPIPQP